MKRSRLILVALVAIVVVVATACSSSKPKAASRARVARPPAPPRPTAKSSTTRVPRSQGGTLHMLGVGDVDYMDPNISYYSTGYMAARMYSRQWVTYPADRRARRPPMSPTSPPQLPTTANGGISSDGLTYKLTIKTGVMWNTTPARQVTGADFVRGLKRTCNPAQPFGGLPDFENLIVGFADYCDGFAKVSATSASAMAAYQNAQQHRRHHRRPEQPAHRRLQADRPGLVLPGHAVAAGVLAGSGRVRPVHPGQRRRWRSTRSPTGRTRSSRTARPSRSCFVRNPSWQASTDTVRKAYVNEIDVNETGNQESIQQQLEANTAGADMEWDTFPTITDVPQLVAIEGPEPAASCRPTRATRTSSSTRCRRTTATRLQNAKVRQALSEAMNRAEMISQIGGTTDQPAADAHLAGRRSRAPRAAPRPSYYPSATAKAKSDLAAAGASNLTLKFLYRPASSIVEGAVHDDPAAAVGRSASR